MEQLIEMVLQALRAAGIHCVRALDEETLPRLKAPMVAVGADPSACRQHALARYLGQDADGAERYGMELQATLQLEVYSPGRRAGGVNAQRRRWWTCFSAASRACIPATSSWGARPMTQGRTASAAPSARR